MPGTRILVIDDDVLPGRAMQRTLRMAGYETDIAHSAAQALVLLEQQAYRIVISDLEMPGVRGDELISTIHQRWPEIDCVLVSGFIVAVGDAVGAERLPKPWSRDQLLGLVERIASRS